MSKEKQKVINAVHGFFEANPALVPAHGVRIGRFIIDEYRGFKSGARLCIIAPNDEGKLSFLLLKEQKYHRDYIQWNLIEGMRNGPDINLDPEEIKSALNKDFPVAGLALDDMHTAVIESMEETGIDLETLNIIPKRVHLRTRADGMQHGPIGVQGNFVYQDASTFRVSLEEQIPVTLPEDTNTKNNGHEEDIKGYEWVSLVDCKNCENESPDGFRKIVKFTDQNGEMQYIDRHQIESIVDSIRDYMLESLLHSRPNMPVAQFEKIKANCPSEIDKLDFWHQDALNQDIVSIAPQNHLL